MRATLALAICVFALLSGCSPPERAEETPPTPREVVADTEFRDKVFEDGVVTREEMEQAIHNMFRCYRERGLEGTVWYDLDNTNWYSADLSLQDKSVGIHEAGDLIPEIAQQCEDLYSEVLWGFEQTRPLASLDETSRLATLACMESKIPEVYAKVDPNWDRETLYSWIIDYSMDYGESSSVATDCMNHFGTPFRPLSDF